MGGSALRSGRQLRIYFFKYWVGFRLTNCQRKGKQHFWPNLRCLGRYDGTFEVQNSWTRCSDMLHESCANGDCTSRQRLLFSHTCRQWRSKNTLTKRSLLKKCNMGSGYKRHCNLIYHLRQKTTFLQLLLRNSKTLNSIMCKSPIRNCASVGKNMWKIRIEIPKYTVAFRVPSLTKVTPQQWSFVVIPCIQNVPNRFKTI